MKLIRYFIYPVLLCFTIYSQEKTYNLNELIDIVNTNNPAIKKAQYNFESAKWEVDKSSNLPDPQLTLGLMNMPLNSFSFNQEPMTGKLLSLTQSFPFPGKLSEKENLLSEQADISSTDISAQKNNLRAKVKRYYYNYFYLKRIDDLLDRKKELLNRLAQVVRTKYEVSSASQQIIFQIELEIKSIETDEIEIRNNFRNQLKNISILTGIKSDSLIISDNSQLDSNLQMLPDYQQLLGLALENRPDILHSELEIKKAAIARKLSHFAYYPDFMVTVQYSQRDALARTGIDQPDFLSVMLGLNIPINYGGKKSAEIQMAETIYKASEVNNLAVLQETETELTALLQKIKTLLEKYDITKSQILNLAEYNFEAALTDYQSNRIDFSAVIGAINKILSVKKDLFDLRLNYYLTVAEIEKVTGTAADKFVGELK